jgi:hypothetical protein
MIKKHMSFCFLFILVGFILFTPISAKAYSVLTHEALIDASWEKSILPLLRLKYPSATDDELNKARAFAYGGSILPDLGYFPFGSVYFTNLAHYARTGDFVEALISESENMNEYAFALGVLCHYMGDKYGHPLATNIIEPSVYPKIEKKFGHVVTYEKDHVAHKRVEIAFDVLEISRGNYASQTYHNFIGFQVSRPVLERAFLKTYGQDINVVFGDLGLTIATFRWSIKSLLPTITHIAWEIKKRDIRLKNPSVNSRSFHYNMNKKQYYAEFGKARKRPGLKAIILSGIVRVIPKIGPLRVLRFKDVGPEGEKLFIRSFDTTLVHYANALNKLHNQKALIPDIDYDTGKPTLMGEYDLADKTYGELVIRLEETKFNNLTALLKQNILNYYSKSDSASLSRIDPKQWKKTYQDLQTLKVTQTIKVDSLKNAKGEYYRLNEPIVKPVTGK